ncbi:MAG: hypothetical protein HYZ68_00715 [Chloroflexi bacterium]|nr:hypothetical protein [Chloroflexota bacterium]
MAELFEAREPFEQAIQAALGPLSQALVIERWADAQAHLHELKRFARVILPLDLARPSQRPQPPSDPGVIGLACDLVTCEAGLQPLCESLLGKTLVVQDLESALRLYQNDSIDCDLVTITGEVLTARGMLHLSANRDDGRQGQGDEEQGVAEERAQLEAQREDLLRALEAENHLHREAESSAEALGEQLRAAQEGLREAERALGEVRRTMERQIQELGWHETIGVDFGGRGDGLSV